MPSSDPITIPAVLKLVGLMHPKSILDVGCGNGRYGFLFREILDFNYGRLIQPTWEVKIDGLEIENRYITCIHGYIYNVVYTLDWLSFEPKINYDLIFMGDILEHFEDGGWETALQKANANSLITMVVSPNWNGSGRQGEWHGFKNEKHRTELSPSKIGGRCVYANSKCFISIFDNAQLGIFEDKNILL